MFVNSIIIFVLLCLVKSAKILVVVSVPSISHQVVFRPLVQELIDRNHEVTVITTDPVYTNGSSPKNLKEIDLHDISYAVWVKWFKEAAKMHENDLISKLTVAFSLVGQAFEEQLKDKKVQELIKNETLKFDLLILEACVNPALIFSHIFQAPVIQMSSFGANPSNTETFGLASHPLIYPMHYRQKLYNLTILEKIHQLYEHVLIERMFKNQEHVDDRKLQMILGKNIPTLNDLKNNVDLLFLNVHPIWVHNQPAPPNVVFTWGIHKIPENDLPEDLQHYLDSSKNGVIYVSFGTNINSSSLGEEILKIFVKVFSRLPYNILWKWDTDELPGKSENVKIRNWFPQVDVLRHPNLKLFITQGGLQSTDEAINAGVPLIGMPLFGDQVYNTEKYEYFKIGIQLDSKSLTADHLENAIKSIFRDYDSYEKNILRLRRQMNDQPKPPLENAMWWIEYALRHGGAKHLRTPAANMSWTEYYELELVFLLFCGSISLVTSFLLFLRYCIKYILHIPIITKWKNNKNKLS